MKNNHDQNKQIAQRLKMARSNADLTAEFMSDKLGITVDEYLTLESGNVDFNFTLLHKCSELLSMDFSALASGDDPKLNFYTVTRKGGGLRISRRESFDYEHLASALKNRLSEPFVVTAKYSAEAEKQDIAMSTHSGMEFNYILKGSLLVKIDDNEEVLHEGDSITYDSSKPHGMIAIGGEDCVFIAVVQKSEYRQNTENEFTSSAPIDAKRELLYSKFMKEETDENGALKNVKFDIPENFNFGYDVVDALAEKCPDKIAMRWLSVDREEKEFTFADISKLTNRAANYFTSLGITKGDKVMLVLKRHYQFWISIIALHKIGAIVIPATNQLVEKDFEYRFKAGDIKAVICTADGNTAQCIDNVADLCPLLTVKIIANGKREGWSNFDEEMPRFRGTFSRVETHKNDVMLMFFTSGTTGYPKIAMHTFTYPLGHTITARWWHNVDPEGIHLTISDTGWGKALWGKLYGQWLCEAAVFVYDFNKFAADDILPLFEKYNITTFCAPPTMYRFFIKEDLNKYDLSSIKHATIAGEALNPEVFYQFQNATGLSLMEGFGQTETTLVIANLHGSTVKPGSMGIPTAQYDVKLVKSDGTEAATGEAGEIVIKCEKYEVPGIFAGYYKQEDKTKEVWYDGYYHTGDMAYMDEDGYFWYVGRVDDLIKSSGYRIGPFEIESVIMELPYVLECAITGVPDEIRGQVVKATIVLVKDKEPSEELKKEIQTYVKKRTAPYKYPRIVEFVTELPKTISGKIKRAEVRKKDNQ